MGAGWTGVVVVGGTGVVDGKYCVGQVWLILGETGIHGPLYRLTFCTVLSSKSKNECHLITFVYMSNF